MILLPCGTVLTGGMHDDTDQYGLNPHGQCPRRYVAPVFNVPLPRRKHTDHSHSRTDPDWNHKHAGGFVSPGSLLSNRPLRLSPSRPFCCRPVPDGSHCPGESACDILASNREASVVAAWVYRALLAALAQELVFSTTEKSIRILIKEKEKQCRLFAARATPEEQSEGEASASQTENEAQECRP